MLERLLDGPFEVWLLGQVARSRVRLEALRVRHPEASTRELALLLARRPRLRAAMGGFLASFGGLLSAPGEEAYSAWLSLTVVVDVAVVLGRPLKSARARREVVEVWREARARLAESATSDRGVADRFLSSRVTRFAAGLVPVVSAPLRAAVREHDVRRVVEVAMRAFGDVPEAVRQLRARRG
jgi:hypothetical protein